MKHLAKNLRFLREGRGLKQADVPGFTGSKWGNYETGTSKPGLDDFVSITKYFGVTETELLHVDLSQKGKFDDLGRYIKNGPQGKADGKGLGKNKPKNEGEKELRERSNYRIPQVVTIDSTGDENVILVPVRARAGYLNGYSDPDFMANLPAYRLPGLNNGTFRLFEVEGLSMYPTLHGGDLIICSFVEELSAIRNDRVHVVVTRNEGVVVKRVLNRISGDGKLILKSDNYKDRDMYPPIVSDPEDVVEVWYATGYISRQLKPPAEIYNRLIDLEGRFTLLEGQVKKSTR